MIKAVLFDFGEVFITSKSKEGNTALLKSCGVSVLKPELRNPYLNFVKGVITSDVYFKKVLESNNNKELSIKSLKKIYSKLYLKHSEIDKVMFKLLDKLHGKYLLVCVSDMNELHRKLNGNKGYFKKFDKLFFSHETKKLKREHYFQEILQELGISASEAIFIDDQEININAAKSQGIKSIKFVGYEDLKNKFESIGILK